MAVLAQDPAAAAGGGACGLNGTVLTARSFADDSGGPYGLNRSAVLWGGPGQQLAGAVERAEHRFGLPSPTLGGRWAKTSPEARRGYWLVDAVVLVNHTSRARMIALAVASGVPYIALTNWAQSAGHYNVSAGLGGLKGLRALVSALRVLGLKGGLHTMSGNIAFSDAYVSPVPDARLAKSTAVHTLAVPLGPGPSGALMVNESTAGMPASGTVQIGHELLTYTGVRQAAPFGLTGITRGAYKTAPAAHAAGSKVARLLPGYAGFLPAPGSNLLDEVAGNIARVFHAANVSMLYFDGAELMPGQYGESAMCRAFDRHLASAGDAVVESSTANAYCWHLTARSGQSDWAATAVRAYFDAVKARAITAAKDDLVTPDLGWAGILDYSPGNWFATTPQQLEYLASKAVAFGGAPSLELAAGPDGSGGSLPANGRSMEAMQRMGLWLRNLSDVDLPDGVRVLLQQPGLDHELEHDDDGWWITPVKVWEPFVVDPRVPASLNVSRPATFSAPSTFVVRVRAMPPIALLGDPANVDFLGANTSVAWTTGCPASFAHRPGQIPTPIPNGSLSAAMAPSPAEAAGAAAGTPPQSLRLRFAAQSTEGIGCLRFQLKAGGLNLTAHRGLGLLLHGDASGALLNIQMEDTRGVIRSHFVAADFSGWRPVALSPYEAGPGFFRHAFPRTVFPDDLRGFEYASVAAINVYVTAATVSTLYIARFESLAEDARPHAAPTRGATIEVGDGAAGTRSLAPFGMCNEGDKSTLCVLDRLPSRDGLAGGQVHKVNETTHSCYFTAQGSPTG